MKSSYGEYTSCFCLNHKRKSINQKNNVENPSALEKGWGLINKVLTAFKKGIPKAVG